MRIIRYIAFGAAALAALVLIAQPVQAACPDASLIQTIDDSVTPVERTFIWTEGYFDVTYGTASAPYSTAGPPITPNFSAVWWEMGRGEANNGTNYWNSPYPQGWMYADELTYYGYPNTYYHAAQIFGGWGQGGVADCVTTGACTCVLLNDAYNNAGYWAVTGNNNDAAVRTTQLRQPGTVAPGFASPIILRPVSTPFFTDSFRTGDTITVTVTVDADPLANYELGTCDCVSGYLLYSQTSTGGAPTDRNVTAGWTLVPGQPSAGTPFGQTFQFDISCAGNEDVYLATQAVGDQGFATGQLSANSAEVECEPGLADPVDDNPLRPFEVDRERGTRPRQGRQGR